MVIPVTTPFVRTAVAVAPLPVAVGGSDRDRGLVAPVPRTAVAVAPLPPPPEIVTVGGNT